MSTYDKADWHAGQPGCENVTMEDAAVHMALFLGWAIRRGGAGSLHPPGSPEVAAFESGAWSCLDFLARCCDYRLTNEDFSDELNPFVDSYYAEYLNDYGALIEPLHPEWYGCPLSDEVIELVEAMLDRRFEEYEARLSSIPPPLMPIADVDLARKRWRWGRR